MNRRDLLKLLGLAGGVAALPLLRMRPASAQAASIPKRLIIFYTGHGTLRYLWPPTGVGGMGSPTENAWDFGTLHTPLQPHKSKINVIHGLDMRSYTDDTAANGARNGHVTGAVHALSATTPQGDTAGGPSLDIFVGQKLKESGVVTRLPSLQLMVGSGTSGHPDWDTALTWLSAGAEAPAMGSPLAAYDLLFPSGPPGPSPVPDPTAQQLFTRRKSALDLVSRELGSLGPRMDKNARAKLEAHATLIRDLEARLMQPAPILQSCQADTRSALSTRLGSCSTAGGDQCIPPRFDAMARIATAALACDQTRVVTLIVSPPPDSETGYNGMYGTTGLHDLVHKVAYPGQSAGMVEMGANFFRTYARYYAALLAMLDGIPESDGQTLLDHTAVLWTSEIGSSNHDLSDIPIMVAGSAGGYFRTGRYIKVAPNTAHNDLHVSLANAVGLSNITTFGNASVCKGPLPNLR
jgi:hypothetical protein